MGFGIDTGVTGVPTFVDFERHGTDDGFDVGVSGLVVGVTKASLAEFKVRLAVIVVFGTTGVIPTTEMSGWFSNGSTESGCILGVTPSSLGLLITEGASTESMGLL